MIELRYHFHNFFSKNIYLSTENRCIANLQWLLGFFTFFYPRAESTTRANMAPWHAFFGIVLFFMTIVTAETGLTQKFIFQGLLRSQEALMINFTGLLILLFGIFVGLSVILPRRNY
ncbi:putative ascorbate ferrireductase (transmembrane) [Helianthus annuus]|uniref:Ascorbate ferrireductase (Transmembrane) n=1 Tax=Helianthus annuus TaxID=4232 RepID=A0A9K3IED1_HELAN|nr:putative ascorbate ferrireductase (transmembrane) [Helianthus annuus]KAJ0553487.1 putative ascorbate ferrireductase (transmembrane) [Helianthus annuus]KAJ0722402.1 putative ascorbate ferrireductase (transmembrane) [Helianthus annuus]KAJ0897812.1 putative ascorbate ferrireductase (transmembrane) [Helianthus annuus]KAJ0901574.1 putative ascorbate ferrireductase (transmembrane) [Helianthus annuus]